MHSTSLQRRFMLGGLVSACLGSVSWANAQGSKTSPSSVTVLQVVDTSAGQIDVSQDFLTGSRAAWQELQLKGGIRGRSVRHRVLEVDGSAESIRSAMNTLKGMPECDLVFGTTGDKVAQQLSQLLRKELPDIAHVAPWLQSSAESADTTIPIFATRREQIAYAVQSLSVMGVSDLGVVYSADEEYKSHHEDIEKIASGLSLKLKSYRNTTDLAQFGKSLPKNAPSILLFLGGTPEVMTFAKGMAQQALQRYIITMADVKLQTLLQSGTLWLSPVIATQVVPLVNTGLPIVRDYRDILARLYDEPPTPQSLAGYISARYAISGLQSIDGPITRQSALQAFQKRSITEVGGFRVASSNKTNPNAFVTQSMLNAQGRLIG